MTSRARYAAITLSAARAVLRFISVAAVACLGGCAFVGGFDGFFIDDTTGQGGTGGGGGGAATGGRGGRGGGSAAGGGGVTGDPCDGPVVFVKTDATGTGDGGGWDDAFTELSNALTFAASCPDVGEIWVAAGSYRPGVQPELSFRLRRGLAVYGGFRGDEMALEQRDVAANVTILTGDIDQNDTTTAGVVTDIADIAGTNSFHVVTAAGTDETAVLDGFTITAGNAAGTNATDGGGIQCDDGGPTLRNLVVRGNRALGRGGGLFSRGTPTVQGATFRDNQVVSATGGAIAIEAGALNLSESAIIDNRSMDNGGGLYLSGSRFALLNVAITGNTTTNHGGGVASIGAAEANDNRFVNVLISGNRADGLGGGVYFLGSSKVALVNLTVTGNRADNRGGGLWLSNDNTMLRITNALIWGNTQGAPAAPREGEIFLEDPNGPDADITISHSILRDSGGSAAWNLIGLAIDGGDNTDVDPLFVAAVSAASAPTDGGNYRLQPPSPARNTGDPSSGNASATDLAGQSRVQGTTIDRGAYEFPE
ncbi:MAG: right-handed parallel beta-helix repeat-containing protein [Myxococcota bacterium]